MPKLQRAWVVLTLRICFESICLRLKKSSKVFMCAQKLTISVSSCDGLITVCRYHEDPSCNSFYLSCSTGSWLAARSIYPSKWLRFRKSRRYLHYHAANLSRASLGACFEYLYVEENLLWPVSYTITSQHAQDSEKFPCDE